MIFTRHASKPDTGMVLLLAVLWLFLVAQPHGQAQIKTDLSPYRLPSAFSSTGRCFDRLASCRLQDGDAADTELQDALKVAALPSKWPNSNYILLRDLCDVTVRPDGTVIRRFRKIFKLYNEQASTLADVSLNLDFDQQAFVFFHARTIRPNGEIKSLPTDAFKTTHPNSEYPLYDNSGLVKFTLPAIEDNCIIDYEWETVTSATIMHGKFQDSWTFNETFPIARSRYTIHIPESLDVTMKMYRDDSLKPRMTTSVADGIKTTRFEMDDIPPLVEEPNMPPLDHIQTWLEVTNLKSWNEYASWYWTLVEPNAKPNEALRVLTRRLIAGKTTQTAKARALYDWVATHIRYVGLEFDISGYRPHPATTVYDKLYGDCKDKATLLITMLGIAGIKAYPVLLETDDSRPIRTYLPGLDWFDHCIALAMVDNREVWLDATAETCAYGDIPDDDRGSDAMVIKDGKAVFKTIPPYLPEQNSLEVQVDATSRANDMVTMEALIKLRGSVATAMRSSLHTMTPSQRSLLISGVVGQNGAKDKSVKVNNFTLPDANNRTDPLVMKLSATGTVAMKRKGHLTYMPISWLAVRLSSTEVQPFTSPQRVHPIYEQSANQRRYQLIYHVPLKYHVVALPPDVTLRFPLHIYRRRFTKSPDGRTVIMDETLTTLAGSVPATEYERERAFYSLDTSQEGEIVLSTTSATERVTSRKSGTASGSGHAAKKTGVPAKPASKDYTAAFDPELRQAIKRAPMAVQWPDQSYVVLSDLADVTVQPDGSVVRRYRRIDKLFNDRARDIAEVSLRYRGDTESIRLVHARTVSPQGEVRTVAPTEVRNTPVQGDDGSSDSQSSLGFSLPAIEDNCIIDYEWERVTKPDSPLGWFSDFWRFDGTAPVGLSRYEVHVPTKFLYKLALYNGSNSKPLLAFAGHDSQPPADSNIPATAGVVRPSFHITPPAPGRAVVSYSFKVLDLAPIPTLAYAPAYPYTWLKVSSLSSWQDYADWYRKLVQPDMEPPDGLRTLTARLIADKPSASEKARTIYEWVVTHVRSVSPLNRTTGNVHPVATSYERLNGNAEDKTLLLITMLKLAAIDASPALLARGDARPVHSYPPSMDWFNHAIAMAQIDGKTVWLDSATDGCAYGDLPSYDRGVDAFVIGVKEGRFEHVPTYQLEEQGSTVDARVTRLPDGKVQTTMAVAMRGASAQVWRPFARNLTDEAKTQTALAFSGTLARQATVKSVTMPPASDLTDPFVIKLTLVSETGFKIEDNKISLPATLYANSDDTFKEPTRSQPIEFSSPSHNRSTIVFDVPAGFKVDRLPANIDLNGPLQSYRRRITTSADGKTVTLTEDTTSQTGTIPVSKYPSVKRYHTQVLEASSDTILLRKTP